MFFWVVGIVVYLMIGLLWGTVVELLSNGTEQETVMVSVLFWPLSFFLITLIGGMIKSYSFISWLAKRIKRRNPKFWGN